MKLGMQVGLGPGHIVLDGDPDALPPKRHSPSPIFGPYPLQPNGCIDQDSTSYGGRPRPGVTVLDGDPAPPPQKRGRSPQIFGPCLLWPNGWMDQDGTWHMEVGLSPGDLLVLDGDSAPPQKGAEPHPQFYVHVYCGRLAGWIKMALGMEVGLAPGHIVLDEEPAPSPKMGQSSPAIFGPFLLSPNG